MALPVVDTEAPGVKELIAGSVKEIANTIFASASVSITAAAKAVTPSIPQMVADITEDLRAGPVDRFSKGLEKLDKLLQRFGGDIKSYNKDLAKFVDQREARIDKSEQTIRELRENNVKAEIDDMGNVKILTQEMIQQKEEELTKINESIKISNEKIAADRKLVEEGNNSEQVRDNIVKEQENVIEKEQERGKLLETLNKTEEDTSDKAQMSISERASKFVDDYVPDQIRDIGGAFIDGLMAPINAVKDLGRFFGALLKPLKFLLKPLMALGKHFKKLGLLMFGFMKKAALAFKGFIMGMIGTIVSMLPFIAIGLALVAAVGLVIAGLVKLMKVIVDNKDALIAFKDRVMEIPGQIADFFRGIFNKIQNFFIDLMNGAIGLINKVLPKKYEIDKLENVPMPADSPAEIVQAEGSPAIAAAQSGTGTAVSSVPPFLNTNNSQSSTNNAAAVINNNAVNNSTVVSSAATSKNNDFARQQLYSDSAA